MPSILEVVRERAVDLWRREGLLDESVRVVAGPLTVEQAIGKPEDNDFPIQKGKERLMEAGFREARGQAFTDHYGMHAGKLREIASLPLDGNFHRAVFVATLNAVMRGMGLVGNTIHCKDGGPKECAAGLPAFVRERYGAPRIAQVGFQPAMIGALCGNFELRVLDLDPDNIGQERRGVRIEGPEHTDDALAWADMLLVTGTTLANDSIGRFLTDKPVLFYGTTIAGAAQLMGWDRYCAKSS